MPLTFRKCTDHDFPRLLSLQETIFATLPDAALLRHNTPEMLRSCLADPHITIGAWDGDTLAAASILYLPQYPAEDLALAYAPDLPDTGVFARRANNKLCMVLPAYRGHHLQLHLGWMIEQEAYQRGIRVLCATASPHNAASCRNLERQGYRLHCQIVKYGYLRNLYVKSLDTTIK